MKYLIIQKLLIGSIIFLFASNIFPIQNKKITVAVIKLDAHRVDDSEAAILTDRLRLEIFRTDKFIVLERAKIDEILKEQGFQQTGATSNEYLVKAGKLLGVQRIIGGSIGKLGNTYTINVRSIDVQTGELLRNETIDHKGEIDNVLTDVVPKIARLICASIIFTVKDKNTGSETSRDTHFHFKAKMTPKRKMRVVLDDKFLDNKNNWSEYAKNKAMAFIKDSKYFIENKDKKKSFTRAKTIELNGKNDFEIEAIIEKIKGTNTWGFGIVWGMSNLDNYYMFVINGNGRYSYLKCFDDYFSKIIDFRDSKYINKNNSTNKLSIKKSNNKIKFFINDHYINEATFNDFFGNRIGFQVNSKMKVAVYNITVREWYY